MSRELLRGPSTGDTACRASREHCHQGGPDKTKQSKFHMASKAAEMLWLQWVLSPLTLKSGFPWTCLCKAQGPSAHLPGGPLHPTELIAWDRGQEGEEQRCCVSLHRGDTPVNGDAHHHPLKQSASVATAPSQDSTGNQKHSQPVTSLLTCTCHQAQTLPSSALNKNGLFSWSLFPKQYSVTTVDREFIQH